MLRILSLLALAIGASAQAPALSSPKVLHDTFTAVWTAVNKNYYDPTFGGVDWNAVKTKYEPHVNDVRSDAELRDLLTRMLGEIKTSHLSIIELATLDKALARAQIAPGLALRDLDHQVVVTRVFDASSAAAAGVKPGFIVKAINGVAVTSAEAAEKTLAANPATHHLTVVDDTDAPRDLELPYKLPPENRLISTPILAGTPRHVLVETTTLEGNIGYVHFTNFIAAMTKRFRPMIDSLHNTSGLIIDLRGNSGGDTEVGLALAGLLVDKETLISTTQTRKGSGERYVAKPQENPYLGKVVMLLDERSASESEELAGGLQAVGRVVVIGRKSRGADLDATLEGLPMKSIALEYPVGLPRTSKGAVIEGHGVTPDIDVPLTRAQLLQGRDAQLEAAIKYFSGR